MEEMVPAPCTPQGVRISDDAVHGSLQLITGLLGFGASSPTLRQTGMSEASPWQLCSTDDRRPVSTLALGNQEEKD